MQRRVCKAKLRAKEFATQKLTRQIAVTNLQAETLEEQHVQRMWECAHVSAWRLYSFAGSSKELATARIVGRSARWRATIYT